MTDTIIGNIKELKSLNNELKTRMVELRSLKLRKKIIENSIIEYLNEKDQPGIKYNNMIILSHEKATRVVRKKPEKINIGMSVLEKYGIQDPAKALGEIMDAMKGDVNKVPCLRIKDNEI